MWWLKHCPVPADKLWDHYVLLQNLSFNRGKKRKDASDKLKMKLVVGTVGFSLKKLKLIGLNEVSQSQVYTDGTLLGSVGIENGEIDPSMDGSSLDSSLQENGHVSRQF